MLGLAEVALAAVGLTEIEQGEIALLVVVLGAECVIELRDGLGVFAALKAHDPDSQAYFARLRLLALQREVALQRLIALASF